MALGQRLVPLKTHLQLKRFFNKVRKHHSVLRKAETKRERGEGKFNRLGQFIQTRTHKFTGAGAGAGAKNETEILQREAEGAILIKMGELITFTFLIEEKIVIH